MENNLLILGASSDVAVALIPRIAANYDVIYAHYHQSADQLKELQGRVSCKMELFQADFTSEEDTNCLINEVASRCANITHILHCPSEIIRNKHFRKTGWDDYAAMLDTQLRSLYYAANCFIPTMAKQRYGKLVTVLSSCTVGTPPTHMSAYITAKYALLGFIRSLAAEYADKSVQINAVSPSMMDTKFWRDTPHLIMEQNAVNHPLKRNAAVEDVIPAIEFFLSDQSGFITGQNLLISGGSVI